jgi:hypothetical protein
MANRWTCNSCSTTNPDTTLTCHGCGMIRGAVVVTPSPSTAGSRGAPAAPPPDLVAWTPQPPGPEPPGASPPGQGAWSSRPPGPEPPGAPPPGQGAWASPAPSGDTPRWNAPPASPAGVRRRRRIPIGLVVVAGFIVVGAVYSWLNDAGRSSTGEIDRAGQLDVSDLRVGDCFNLTNPDALQVQEVAARPCAEAHHYELMFVDEMTGTAFPDHDTVQMFVVQRCLPAFASYVGVDYQVSLLELDWFSPTDAGWSHGDRTVQCAIFDPSQDQVTGSLKGVAR